MTERKYMTVQEFVDSGLLFEVNRRVLHPLGVAIEVKLEKEEGAEMEFGGVWDCRDDPEGILFEETSFWRGMRKWCAYLAKAGQRAMTTRQSVIGFVRQTETPFKPGDVLILWNYDIPTLPHRMRVLEVNLEGTEYKIRDLEAKPFKVKVKGREETREPVGAIASNIVHRNYHLEDDNG